MTFDRMLERLEAAFERQRRFTADASHELRAPLSVIHVAAELALRRERSAPAYRHVLESILRATEQLEELTARLLVAARADADQLQREQLDFSTVVADTIEHLTPLAQAKSIQVVASLRPSVWIEGDRIGLLRAITALIDNAIKYSPAQGVIRAVVAAENGRARFTLRDEGPGFSAQGLDRATDRFWRQDPVRAADTGSGLGLAICNSIVRACGGTLELRNADDGGALVAVEFPARRPTLVDGGCSTQET